MSLDSVLDAGRRAAQARMTSRATVKREGGPPVIVDGLEVPGWTILLSMLPCWVDNNGPSSGTRAVTVGQTEVQVASRVLKTPHDTTGLRDGDVVQIQGGACDGRFFRIVEATIADQKKQQELPIVEVQQPEGWSA